jgi:hypothetical protein
MEEEYRWITEPTLRSRTHGWPIVSAERVGLPRTPLCHADGGGNMRSYSNEKDIQWMQRTLSDLKARIEGNRSAALSTFPQPDFSVSAPKSFGLDCSMLAENECLPQETGGSSVTWDPKGDAHERLPS